MKKPSFPYLLFKQANIPVDLHDLYYGRTGGSAVYLGAGPSLRAVDASLLRRRGVLVFGVNNVAARHYRPQVWASTDEPSSFSNVIWRDPGILKLVTEQHYNKVSCCPNTLYYKKNEDFKVSTYLEEDTVSFGCSKNKVDELGNKGRRSTMLCAIKLMYYLGIRNIYLLGCDFHMEHGNPYAFEQGKWTGGCESNNLGFDILSSRFHSLLPSFDESGLNVVNVTENSKLTVFPQKSLQEVIESLEIPEAKKGSLAGMYKGRD